MSVRLFFFFDREKKGIAIHKRVKRIRLLNDTARMHFVWVWVCAYGKVFLSGWTSERVSLLTIQFRKLKSTYLGVDEWNYIAMQYTFHVFRLCVFVYCTCAKLNLSLPPKNVETWLHCCFMCACVCVCRKDPICHANANTNCKAKARTHAHIRYCWNALIMGQKIINIIYLFS